MNYSSLYCKGLFKKAYRMKIFVFLIYTTATYGMQYNWEVVPMPNLEVCEQIKDTLNIQRPIARPNMLGGSMKISGPSIIQCVEVKSTEELSN